MRSLSFPLIPMPILNFISIPFNITDSHQKLLVQIFPQQKVPHSLTHINLFLLLLAQTLKHLAGLNVELLADVAKALHLDRRLLAFFIQTADSGRLHHWNVPQLDFVVKDEPGDQDSSVCGQLHGSQVPNLNEVLSERGRPIPRRMVSEHASKNYIIAFFSRRKFFFSSHIQHADPSLQFGSHLLQALSLQLILLLIFGEALLELCHVFLILLFVLSVILVERLCVGDEQPRGRTAEILLHGLVLRQTPLEQVGLHVLHHEDGNNFGLHQIIFNIIEDRHQRYKETGVEKKGNIKRGNNHDQE